MAAVAWALGKGMAVVVAIVLAAWVAVGCRAPGGDDAPGLADATIDTGSLWLSRESGEWGVLVRLPEKELEAAGPHGTGRVTLRLEGADRGQLAVDTVVCPAKPGWQEVRGRVVLPGGVEWVHVTAYVCKPQDAEKEVRGED